MIIDDIRDAIFREAYKEENLFRNGEINWDFVEVALYEQYGSELGSGFEEVFDILSREFIRKETVDLAHALIDNVTSDQSRVVH